MLAEGIGLNQGRVYHLLAFDRNTLRHHSRRQEDAAPEDADPRDCGNQEVLWVSSDLCPVTAGRLSGESQESGAALLSRRRALGSASQREEGVGVPRVALPTPTQPGRCYAMDSVYDRFVTGPRFKVLTRPIFTQKKGNGRHGSFNQPSRLMPL